VGTLEDHPQGLSPHSFLRTCGMTEQFGEKLNELAVL
jgi:hypothetical protein